MLLYPCIHKLHVLYFLSITSAFSSVPSLTLPSLLILSIFLPSFYCHTHIDFTVPSLSSHPALHLLSLLHFLTPSSLLLIESRSSGSQIDFAAVLWSPINSQIGFPTYPLPLALCISFSLSGSSIPPPTRTNHPPPINLCSLLAFCLSSVPLHLICYFVVFLTHTHMCVHRGNCSPDYR